MTMESDLQAFVIADGDVTALIASRMFPLTYPQGQSVPGIRYTMITSDSELHLGGVTGEARATVQLDCYAGTYAVAADLAEKVRVALVANNNGARTMGSTVVTQTRLTAKVDEPPFREPDASDKLRYNRSLDFELDYTEAAPA